MIDYQERLPSPTEYRELRQSVAWNPFDDDDAAAGLEASLYGVCAIAQTDGGVVGMARVVGDGRLVFYVQDVIVRPEFQGLGVGGELMRRVMAHIDGRAAPNAFIGLMSVAGKEAFYEKFGFWRRPDGRFGFGMNLFVGNLIRPPSRA